MLRVERWRSIDERIDFAASTEAAAIALEDEDQEREMHLALAHYADYLLGHAWPGRYMGGSRR